MVALQGDVFAEATVAQFDEGSKLLRPIAGDSTADGEDTQLFLTQKRSGEVLEVFERIETNLVSPGRFAEAIVQRGVET